MLEIKQLPQSEVEIAGEMSGEEFSKFWPQAVAELGKGVSLPGFRPGRIPERVLIERVGETAVLEKAAELALQSIFPRIVKEKKLEVIGPPRAQVTKIAKGAPLGFKFQAVLLPEIQLHENFKQIAAAVLNKKAEIKVEDKEIDDALEYLRKTRVKNEDNAVLPELNDEFAKSLGEFKSSAELREALRKNLLAEKEAKEKESRRLEALDAILRNSRVEIPDLLLQAEKDKMLQQIKSNVTNMGLTWEDYLKHIKKSEQELLNGWTDDALKRVKYGLLLRQLEGVFQIEVSEKEILDSGYPKDYAYGIIRNEKIFLCLSQQS
jgi:FKBP-type peptidyl-prolyl cis-trans isomerase (trigger factor)